MKIEEEKLERLEYIAFWLLFIGTLLIGAAT